MTANPQTCQKCGSPVTPGMKFCESCGAKIEALPACPQCGATLVPEVKFCESCGAPVGPAALPAAVKPAGTVPVAAPVSPAPETPPVPDIKPPAEPPVKAMEKTVPAPKEKTAPAPAPVKELPKAEKAVVMPKEAGPRKPIARQTMIIAGIIVLALLGAAVYFVVLPMLPGSGIPGQAPQASAGTTSPGSSSGTQATTGDTGQAGTFPLTAGPTQVPPKNLALIVDVERNAISHDITVTFQGGDGQYGVRELVITLTRSDGTVETKSLGHLERGSSITLKGTDKTDRVEVTANYFNGATYKIVDQVFEYKKRVGSG
jgi:hypothetical protein